MKLIITITLALILNIANAQTETWHLELTPNINHDFLMPFGVIDETNDGYVCAISDNILELDFDGQLKYHYKKEIDFPSNPDFIFLQTTFIKKMEHGYLRVGATGLPSNYTIIQYIGFDNQMIYSKKIYVSASTALGRKTPTAVYDDSDQSLLVASKDSIYLIEAETSDIIWSVFQDGYYSDVQLHNNKYYTINQHGELLEISKTGQINWVKNLNVAPYSLSIFNNKILVGARNTNNDEATLLFLDLNGDLISQQVYGFGRIYDIENTSDGNLILGVKDTNNIILIETDEFGTIESQQSFGEGSGINVKQTADNGFLILIGQRVGSSSTTNENAQIIKINNNKITSEEKKKLFPNNYNYLDINNVKAMANADGHLFQDDENNGFFQIPKETGKHFMKYAGLHLGGYDENDELKFAVNARNTVHGREDFQAGFGGWDSEIFQKVWKINRSDVAHIRKQIANGVSNPSIPYDILTYPAKGNPHFSGRFNVFFEITKDAAPFVDANNDGIYNVYDGDYPVMKGDQMLVWLMNDEKSSVKVGVDVIGTIYGYECNGNENLSNSVFLHFDIKNTSQNNYHDFYFGMQNYMSIGCFLDDFIGVNVPTNTIFTYNSTANDDNTNGCPNILYSPEIPMQTMTALNHDLASFIPFPTSSFGFIPTLESYYNQLKGTWFDGIPLTYGGTGHFSSTDTTTFYCPSNPADTSGWSMYNAFSASNGANSVTGIGAVNFGIGESLELETVYIHHPNVQHPAPDIMQQVIPNVKNIQQFYDNNELDWEIGFGQNNTIEFGKLLTLQPNTNSNFTYDWSTGETTPTIDISNLETYSVIVTDLKGCQKSDSITISDYRLTPNDEEINTYLFPNPTTDNFSVQFETSENLGELYFRLSNAIGHILKYKATTETADLLTFNVSDLSTGVYFLIISSNERHLRTLKVIVL